MKKKTTEQFVKEAKQIHGDRYDYSKVVYKTNSSNVTITCREHGDFFQYPSSHLKGSSCPVCSYSSRGRNRRKSKETFITQSKEAHGNKYDYSKVDYVGAKTKVTITCPIHGDFEQVPMSHVKGIGCKKCGIARSVEKQSSTWDTFVSEANRIHDGWYSYDKFIYTNSATKGIIICPVHGEFKQTPGNHIYTHQKGCPSCAKRKSTESEILGMAEEEKNLRYYLYHIRISKEDLIFDKIGVTKFSDVFLRYRYKSYSSFDIKVIAIKEGRKEDLLLKELEILNEMESAHARFKLSSYLKGNFDGWTECFFIDEYNPHSHF